jgi:hypothetical protein
MNRASSRPIKPRDYLPEVFRGDNTTPFDFQNRFLQAFEDVFEELQSLIEGVSGGDLRLAFNSLGATATIKVQALASSAASFPAGSTVTDTSTSGTAQLAQALPANMTGLTRVEISGPAFALALQPGEKLQVTGSDGGEKLLLTFDTVERIEIKIKSPADPPAKFPANTFVTLLLPSGSDTDSTTLTADYPDPDADPTRLQLRDADFVRALTPGSELVLHSGGLPDLFHPGLTPPPQFARRLALDDYKPEPASAFLEFLASWIGLPLRTDLIRRAGETDANGQPWVDDMPYEWRKARWNRHLVRTAVGIYARRGTRTGVEGMLRAWLKNDLVEGGVLVTDLLRSHPDVDAVFQIGVRATLGVDTVLGEGPPFFFIADLTVDPTVRGLRHPAGIDVFLREARFILDTETPAHTYYQLRVRATTMQLAPVPGREVAGEIYAQVGETALLWGEPSVFLTRMGAMP